MEQNSKPEKTNPFAAIALASARRQTTNENQLASSPSKMYFSNKGENPVESVEEQSDDDENLLSQTQKNKIYVQTPASVYSSPE